jgi:hypothetical protein
MHPLVELARRANARPLCWKIACTTCGAGELRGGISLLARGDRLDQTPWPDPGPPYDSSPLTAAEAGGLARVCVSAPLDQVARVASFPDWLDYLGMILWQLETSWVGENPPFRFGADFEEHRRRIGASWGLQFIGLGGDPAAWIPFWSRPITHMDLGMAEGQRLGDFPSVTQVRTEQRPSEQLFNPDE